MTSTPTPASRPPFIRSISSGSIKPTRDKPRLYIALYPRGGSSKTSSFRNHLTCDSYHWSLVVAPQSALRTDPGTRYHVAHLEPGPGKYCYEEQDMPSHPGAQTALVRITCAKVTDEHRLQTLLRGVPVREDDSAFSCLSWVRAAFTKLLDDGKSVKSFLKPDEWNAVEACARKYCKRKRDVGRFQDEPNGAGGYYRVQWDDDKISTFNFWENRETTL